MLTLQRALSTTVGKKYLVAATGLGAVGFMVTHLAANVLLYFPSGAPYNGYVQKLHAWGPLLTVAELGLLGLFLLHVILAIAVTVKNKSARSQKYATHQTKSGPSRWNSSSGYMIVTGSVLLVFLISHIWTFRFGPGIAEGYTATVNGETVRDLHRLVVEKFKDPYFTGFYLFVIALFGMHLRHGFWSAFQSLGAMNPRFSKPVNALGVALAILLAGGFFGIPIYLYFCATGAGA